MTDGNGASATTREWCKGITKAGHPCRTIAPVGPTGYCTRHDPDPAVKAAVKASQKRGAATSNADRRRKGLRESTLPQLTDMCSALQYSALLTHALATGELPAYAGRAAISALRHWCQLHESANLERELNTVRAAMRECLRTNSIEPLRKVVEQHVNGSGA